MHNRSLHTNLIVLTVSIAAVLWIDAEARLEVKQPAPWFWRAPAAFGFMERPDIPMAIEHMRKHSRGADMQDLTFYVGHVTVRHR